MAVSQKNGSLTFVVEHLDPELGPWSSLEYQCIASESHDSGCNFILSSVPGSLKAKLDTQSWSKASIETRSVEIIFAAEKSRVCLLDPKAIEELSPADATQFDVFLFGGILGRSRRDCK